MRAGLYAWVSTDEEATLSLQNNALLAYVAAAWLDGDLPDRGHWLGGGGASRARGADEAGPRTRWMSLWSGVWTDGATRWRTWCRRSKN